MRYDKWTLLCLVLVLSTLGPITARRSYSRGGSHSYPKSGGLSGSGSRGHSYPSSGGLSGGGSHSYPPSGGLSGGGSHGYPSSGGMSGGGKGYPSQSGGSHSYPSSNGGLSGGGTHHTNTHSYPASKGVAGSTTTNIHHHYNYNPPQQIRYTPVHGGPPVSYPVYHGTPPTYVYQYKDSGSKYGTLLAGLALLNLGTFAGTAYLASKSHSNYKPQPGEVCKFGLKKDNGDYEETKIDCQLITSFIFLEEEKAKHGGSNTTITTTTVTNVTTVNMTNPEIGATPLNQTVSNPLYQMLPNGTLIPLNTTDTAVNSTSNVSGANNNTSSVIVTTTTTNTTTVTNALDVKGKEVVVTPGMQCFIIRDTPSSRMRKTVPCDLLQTYAKQSLQKKNSAIRNTPALMVLSVVLAAYAIF